MYFTPFPPILSITMQDLTRFWSKVKRSESCWDWTAGTRRVLSSGGLLGDPYGLFSLKHTKAEKSFDYLAHRVSYFLNSKKDPGSMLVCHECNNTLCVRPDHLFLGTHSENCQHRTDSGNSQRGSLNSTSKLWEEDIPTILRHRSNGETLLSIGQSFGVSWRTIYDIVNNKTWCHIPR